MKLAGAREKSRYSFTTQFWHTAPCHRILKTWLNSEVKTQQKKNVLGIIRYKTTPPLTQELLESPRTGEQSENYHQTLVLFLYFLPASAPLSIWGTHHSPPTITAGSHLAPVTITGPALGRAKDKPYSGKTTTLTTVLSATEPLQTGFWVRQMLCWT